LNYLTIFFTNFAKILTSGGWSAVDHSPHLTKGARVRVTMLLALVEKMAKFDKI